MKTQLNPGPFVAIKGHRPDDRTSVQLAVRLTEQQFEGVMLYAKAHGMPVSTAVRQLAMLALSAAGERVQ